MKKMEAVHQAMDARRRASKQRLRHYRNNRMAQSHAVAARKGEIIWNSRPESRPDGQSPNQNTIVR